MADEFPNDSSNESVTSAPESAPPVAAEATDNAEFTADRPEPITFEAAFEEELSARRGEAEEDVQHSEPSPEQRLQETPKPEVIDPRQALWNELYPEDPFPQGDFRSAMRARERQAAELEIAEEDQFQEMYVSALMARENDPEAYIAMVDEFPDLPQFMAAYKASHPEVTLDTPFRAASRPEAVIRDEVGRQIVGTLADALADIAKENGVEFAADPTKPGQMVWGFVEKMAKHQADAEIARQLPKIREEERKAAGLEAQRRYASKMPVLHANGAHAGGRPVTEKTGDLVADSFREAKQAIESR